MEEKEEKLYIPTNTLDRDDYISGFGKTELEIASVIFLICLLTAIFIIQINEQYMFVCVVSTTIVLGVSISLIWRDQYDESLIEKIRQIIAYQRESRKYMYEYYDWISDYMEVEKDAPKGKRN